MHHIELAGITLKGGGHASRESGVCLLEAVAWWADEQHSDHPECVSPVLAAFGRSWNDGMRSDEEREQLKQYITLLPGTNTGAADDETRAWMALDWLVRTHTVAWMTLAGGECAMHAAKLAALPVITKAHIADARPQIAAAGAAAGAAARDAAGAAAWDAAWAAARAAAWDAAWAAARAAARAAAWDAAWAAAGAAARDAAWAAAGDKLQPTVEELQASAHVLFRDMIAVGQKVPA